MDYQRGFSTQQRPILAQPFQGRMQTGRLGVDDAFHGPTMLQPHLLNPVNFRKGLHCGAAHTLIKSRPWFQKKIVKFSNLNKQVLTPKWHFLAWAKLKLRFGAAWWVRPEGLGPNCPVMRQKPSAMDGMAFGFFPVTEQFVRQRTLFLFMST